MADESRMLDKKLDLFLAEVMGIARQKCKAIEQEAESYRQKELESYRLQAVGENSQQVDAELAEMEVSVKTAISGEKARLRRELLQTRESYKNHVFEVAAQRLRDFVSGPDYEALLLAKAHQLAGTYTFENATVLVRAADVSMADALKTVFAGCTVLADEDIALGGLILQNQDGSLRVDATLDSALEAQKEWFYQNSGLQITL